VLSGTPKEISKTADSGNKITSCFCGDCGKPCQVLEAFWADGVTGTTLYRYGDTFGGVDGMRIVKAGILDDVNVINNTKPGAELYAPERVQWVSALEGANQVDSMPPPS